MKPDYKMIKKQAFELFETERAKLMNELYDTLLSDEQRERERRWGEEADRRLADYDAGRESAETWSELR
jgi:putative addiction module component (TIGR02574 family)